MTVQDKAKELIEKFYTEITSCPFEGVIDGNDMAKSCAIKCVDEIIDLLKPLNQLYDDPRPTAYWESVKQEIEKL